jgi:hypothetical protein
VADLTPADLDRLEALAAAATLGPWSAIPSRHHTWHVLDGYGMVLVEDLFSGDDAALIAAAREAVPTLVAEVRRLRALTRS